MFERKNEPLLPRRHFYRRLVRSFSMGIALVVVSMLLGMLGYRSFEHMAWIDAFLNASMLMSGMGPVGELHTNAGKLFAGIYALYCGLALITAAALILTPIVHRFFHRFHLEDDPPGT